VFFGRLLLSTPLLVLAACSQAATTPTAAPAGESGIQVFASPEGAATALEAAVKSGSESALRAMFGPDSKELISSGDPVEDKNTRAAFIAAYDVMHRWRTLADRSQTLVVGADNFPFPIPLKRNARGTWQFDTAAGRDEILNRRIGGNERAVIDTCRATANAQEEYYSQLHDGSAAHQYAMKFLSDPGREDGLYWQSAAGQPRSPIGPLVALATSEGYSATGRNPTPFHGYYFRVLTAQGAEAPGGARDYVIGGKMTEGFAILAYPVQYGVSGVMTFMINQDAVLLQKDLGKSTSETARAMKAYDPGADWGPVED